MSFAAAERRQLQGAASSVPCWCCTSHPTCTDCSTPRATRHTSACPFTALVAWGCALPRSPPPLPKERTQPPDGTGQRYKPTWHRDVGIPGPPPCHPPTPSVYLAVGKPPPQPLQAASHEPAAGFLLLTASSRSFVPQKVLWESLRQAAPGSACPRPPHPSQGQVPVPSGRGRGEAAEQMGGREVRG